MKVTSVQPYKGKTIRIDFDCGAPLFINSDIAAEHHIVAGCELSEEQAAAAVHSNEVRRAKERALYLLDNRDYSYTELFKKLEQSYDDDVCYEVLNRLAKLGCIDDRRYADSLAERLFTVKKYGAYRVREELRLKGLPKELVDEAIAKYSEGALDRLVLLIERKYARYLSDDKGINKVKLALVRLGYSYSDVNTALEQFVDS